MPKVLLRIVHILVHTHTLRIYPLIYLKNKNKAKVMAFVN